MNSKFKDIVPSYLPFIILLTTVLFSCSSDFSSSITLENRYFKYEIDKQGKNLHFIDKVSGKDYLKSDSLTYCASLISNGEKMFVTDVSYKRNQLNLGFSKAGVTIGIKVKKTKNHVSFEVETVKGAVDELTFINVPLQLEGMPYEPFAACILSMNIFTRVRELPALQSHLWASCYKRFGIIGAKVTMIGVPQKQILPVIRDVVSHSKDIPYSDKGGAWAMMQKEGYGSYLMNFGTLTEETVEEWIDMCNSLGFNQIDNHGGGAFFKFGDFELNKDKWPDGWESFKRINDRLHEAGISSIFHTYAFFIDKNSRYVTPVPSEDLGYFNSFTLAKPLHDSDSVIVVNESTANISTITGFFVYDSYRHTVQFNNVNKLQLWYNNLPENKEVSCLIGSIKALPMVPITISNPVITIGNEKLIFPVKMESGMYIEYISKNDCKLYGTKGEFLKDIDIEGSIPTLNHGDNEIRFTCNDKGKVNSRVQITVISEGKPLNIIE